MNGRHITYLRVTVFALLYFACAMLALVLSGAEDGVAAIWPASGIFVAGLLLIERDARGLLIAGVALSSLVANLIGGVGPGAAIGYTVANILEGLIVLRLMGPYRDRSFIEPATLVRFLGAIAVGGAASALMAGALSLNFSMTFLTSWASTVILGMATVTPTIMFMMADRTNWLELFSLRGIMALLFVAGLAIAAFGQSAYPLLFLPMAGLAFATYTFGLSGSSSALIIVTAIGSYFTAEGIGPVSSHFATVPAQVLYFQGYIICMIASILPLGILLSRHKNDAARHRELAETDQLTGMATRRKILAQLELDMERARNSERPLAIAMIDIDHFKSINDRFGHIHGDQILAKLGEMMRGELGQHSLLGRLGGEEFIAIFVGKTTQQIMGWSERLRERVASHDWPKDGPEQVTLSVGIAEFKPEHEIAGHFLRDADIALYRAKDEGRNLCLIYREMEAVDA